MQIIADMGTSNTRLYLVCDKTVRNQLHLPFGARVVSRLGKDYLYQELRKGISELLQTENASINDLECIVVYGMGGSEYGIKEVEHIPAPVSARDLAENIRVFSVPQISDVPVMVIPGIKLFDEENNVIEIMRGEETEAVGFIGRHAVNEDIVVLLPGTHCKMIHISKGEKIVGFSSSLSGEMIQALAENTILSKAVDINSPLDKEYLIKGARTAGKKGLNCTLLDVRTMYLSNNYTISQTTSYFLGAVLEPEIRFIVQNVGNKKVYVGGDPALKQRYIELLREYAEVSARPIEDSELLGLYGALKILEIKDNLEEKKRVIEAVYSEKLIAILRGLAKEDYIPVVQALYDGGIRIVEVPFDASGKRSDTETAEIIRELSNRFSGKMHIGVGSVLKTSQVNLAAESGASFIISPNVNQQVIRWTIELGLVSIPGCFTPTEAVTAYEYGADFIKVFPNNLGKENYIKAIRAPLPHIPLLAVGGVNPDNMIDMLRSGAVGLGMGSMFLDKSLVESGDYKAIRDRAKKCVDIIKDFKGR